MIFAGTTQAPHYSRQNGGVAPDAREYFARNTQRTDHGPRIDAATEGMLPGEFRPVWLGVQGLFSVWRPDRAGAYDTLDWTPYAVWHRQTRQMIIGGRRIMNKVVAYSDVTGNAREIAMPASLGRWKGTGHWYGETAQDDAGTVYLKGHAYHPESDTWRQLPPHVTTNGGNGSSYAWMSNALDGKGGLVKYGGNSHRFLMYDPVSNAWPFYKSSLPNGEHAIVGFHPAHGKLLMIGGNDSGLVTCLVDEFGNAVRVADCPMYVRMSKSSWIVPHPAGCWLVRVFEPTSNLLAYWPLTDQWQDLGPASDAAVKFPTAALDAERGLVLIAGTKGIYAYKLPAL